jgi:predicted ATPase
MFTSIQIQNFRSLRSVSVSKLRRLNIVTGRNAGGKTSLLEALFLNAGGANAGLLFSINNFRGDLVIHQETDRVFSTCFADMDFHKSVVISVSERRQHRDKSRVLTLTGQTSTKVQPGQSRPETFLSGIQVGFAGPSGKATASAEVDFSYDPNITPGSPPKAPVRFSGGDGKDLVFAQFLSPYIRDAYQDTYNQLTAVIKQKGIDSILEVIGLIQAKVKNLVALSEVGQPMIYVDTGGPRLLPASVLGAGFIHILKLSLAMSQIDRGILIIDELEDGLHYRTFPKVLAAIIDFLVTRTDAQVFLATHSAELIDAALQVAAEKKFKDYCLLNLVASDLGPQARYFGSDEIAFAKDLDAELR